MSQAPRLHKTSRFFTGEKAICPTTIDPELSAIASRGDLLVRSVTDSWRPMKVFCGVHKYSCGAIILEQQVYRTQLGTRNTDCQTRTDRSVFRLTQACNVIANAHSLATDEGSSSESN